MNSTLEALAQWSWMTVWIPLLAWTAVAGLALLGVNAIPQTYLRLRRNLIVALLVALPLGLVLGQVVPSPDLLSPAPSQLVSWAPAAPSEVVATNPEASPPAESWSIPAWVGLLHVLVLIVILGRLAVHVDSSRRLGLFVRCARPYTGPRPDLPQLEGMDVRVSAGTRVPFSAGVRQRSIVLPRTGPSDARLAIAHEAFHHHEGDVLRMNVVRLIAVVFAFHPLVNRLARQVALEVEKLCDQLVLAHTGANPSTYAQLLLAYVPASGPRNAVMMAQSHSELKQRISAMNTLPRGSRSASLVLSFFLLVVAAGAVACSQGDPAIDLDAAVQDGGLYSVSGVVKDPETGQPLTGTNVVVKNTQRGAVVDPSGYYFIKDIPAGTHDLVFSYVGRESLEQRVQIPAKPDELYAAVNSGFDHQRMLTISVDETGLAHLEGVSVGLRELERRLSGLSKSALVSLRVSGAAPSGSVQEIQNVLRNSVAGVSYSVRTAPLAPKVASKSDDKDLFVVVEEMPELEGGLAAVQKEIRYPQLAKNAGIEGRVILQFVVNEQGDVEDPVVVRGIGGGCDEEALRAVKEMSFKPGRQRGKPVKVKMSIPITFSLDAA